MRPDMSKVIVERPRYGSCMRGQAKGYWRDLKRTDLDELPKRERIKPTRGNTKSLSENLSPLRRFLQKQIGRPWDKVFAEICAYISRDSAVQDHVRDHVGDFVAINVVEIDGILHAIARWGGVYPLQNVRRYPFYYVCPKTGLLKRIKAMRGRYRKPEESPVLHIAFDFQTSFIRKAGIWHRVTLNVYPKNPRPKSHDLPFTIFDALMQKPISRPDAVEFYGRSVYATEARRATRDEIREHCEPLKAPNLVSTRGR